MPTRDELNQKSNATRLKNLLARKAKGDKLSKTDEGILKSLKAKVAKAKRAKTPGSALI